MCLALVSDANRTYIVVGRDSTVRSNTQDAPAFEADKTAPRITGRFGIGIATLAQVGEKGPDRKWS